MVIARLKRFLGRGARAKMLKEQGLMGKKTNKNTPKSPFMRSRTKKWK